MVALDVAERLTREDVENIAVLAHLELTEREKDLFVRQLTEILGYAEQIRAIDTTGVPPTSHVLSRQPADRADDVQPPLPRADALRNAPDPALAAGLFRVPRVIG
jgi:aspartyl-tRNA(Asn)/glutamyl-tRNA(Gln) amidotransferase subunit C